MKIVVPATLKVPAHTDIEGNEYLEIEVPNPAFKGYPVIDDQPSACCGAIVAYVEDQKTAKCTKCGHREGNKYRDARGEEFTASVLEEA